jgi:propanediol dehydratase small subunit
MTLSQSEMTALAILRGGGSFSEAVEISQVPIDRIMKIWNNLKQR